MTVSRVIGVNEAIQQMALVAEYNAGYHYTNEAEADAIGEPSLNACVKYHGEQAKVWDEVAKKLKTLL